MEKLIFNHADYERLYNCSKININEVPFEKRQHIWPSVILMTLFIIYHILYIPCTISIWKHRENACYKLLFFIAIVDMVCMWIAGFESAIFGFIGAVFCTCPTLMYVSGAIVGALWCAESSAEIVLAINRSLVILSPRLTQKLFGGNKTWFWLMLVGSYATTWFILYKPPLFSSVYFAWFWDPYTGYIEDKDGIYVNRYHNAHNLAIIFVIPGIYAIFCILLIIKTRLLKSISQDNSSTTTKMTFLQVFLISSLNVGCCILYHHVSSEALMIVGHFFWFHIHGVCPLIYLTLNKTIRYDCKMMFYKVFKKDRVSKIHGVTLVMPMPISSNAR